MRERHWDQLSEALDFELRIDDAFTLQNVFALDLGDRIETIQEVRLSFSLLLRSCVLRAGVQVRCVLVVATVWVVPIASLHPPPHPPPPPLFPFR